MNYLDELESESIYVLREAFAQFENPALLFSGGKDSLLCYHLAKKAFEPLPMPFPLVHIDTGHNFQETLAFRDELVRKSGAMLIVGYVQDSIDNGTAIEEHGHHASRNALQTVTLLETIEKHGFDCCIGGARRDEEKARAKERFFSHRDEFGQWNPRNQRPELWNLYNGKKKEGEHFRVFPISNWTELDVWNYIKREEIQIPSLYISHKREVFYRNGVYYSNTPYMSRNPDERLEIKQVRFRTIGDVTCTGAIVSNASNLTEVIDEITKSKLTERGTRIDDKRSASSMEDRKSQGYF
ncbi:MAG: sulfate adenylyltransferase subunit CysD [Bacteroidetes bacterium]|nr:sulfate adenylyltransferase subunit CysD [Bacteroidota bacterium]